MPEQRRPRTRTPSAQKQAEGSSGVAPEEAARRACRWLEELISHMVEGVSAVQRSDDGWCVGVDMLELPRIPDSTSLLATYEVQLDREGGLVGYRRVRRFRRGAADE